MSENIHKVVIELPETIRELKNLKGRPYAFVRIDSGGFTFGVCSSENAEKPDETFLFLPWSSFSKEFKELSEREPKEVAKKVVDQIAYFEQVHRANSNHQI